MKSDRRAEIHGDSPMSDVTVLVDAIQSGDPDAPAQLLPLVYEEWRRLARHRLAHEPPGQTLQPTDRVHEAYLRLAIGGSLASPSTAYLYDWNILPVGQLLWLKELESYKEYPPLQLAASYNLD
jgi:hypothetical protein